MDKSNKEKADNAKEEAKKMLFGKYATEEEAEKSDAADPKPALQHRT